jgi:hypothetical protein
LISKNKRVKVLGMIALIIISTFIPSKMVIADCGCSDEPNLPEPTKGIIIKEKVQKDTIKFLLKQTQYKLLEERLESRGLFADVKSATVEVIQFNTDTRLLEVTFVKIPFLPKCNCSSVFIGEIFASFGTGDLGVIGKIRSRETVTDPWKEELLMFSDEVTIVTVLMPQFQTRDCHEAFMWICQIASHVSCAGFATAIASYYPPMYWAAYIGCMAAGYSICNELSICWCEGECGSVPGCSSYPPCVCDPYENCD